MISSQSALWSSLATNDYQKYDSNPFLNKDFVPGTLVMNNDVGQIAKVILKKKDIFAGFMDAELYAMQEYAKRNGIKLKEATDFVAVFKGVNTTPQED